MSRQPRRHKLALLLTVTLVTACAVTPKARDIRKAEAGKRGFSESGLASWYGPGFHGRLTANGEVYDMDSMTAAHKHLPFNTVVQVVNRDNGKKVEVRINDRGPFVRGRIIDLSRAAAHKIGMIGPGTARITLRVIEQSSRQARLYGASPDTKAGRVAPARRKATRFRLQLGAFRDGWRAEALWERARTVRKDVRVRLSDGLFVVETGPFSSRKRAEQARRELERAGFDTALVPLPA